MITILSKEWKAYFQSATGYIFMTVYLFLFGIYFTYLNVIPTPNNAFTTTLSNMVFIFVLVSPILTMKTVSEERKNRTDQLLFTSPNSIAKIIIGKFLAAEMLFLFTLAITIVYPILLSFYGSIPYASIITAYIGFFFMGSSILALGVFISSLTESQVIAGVTTLGVSMFIWLIGSISYNFPTDSFSGMIFILFLFLFACMLIYQFSKSMLLAMFSAIICVGLIFGLYFVKKELFAGIIISFVNWFSLPKHSKDFYLGILNISDLVYYMTFIIGFLFFTIRFIEKRRWS
ncbi:ABC transporter permease [Caldibacillus lycopersici]|uniref:ABC transporter permease n=1 Tax=Perspicuibacillus lycopersici TaxID=1325689 RepID=A0AAE3IV57_9BACI|nr:ABC transporter permease [Perspicuibacillus lycopersici]MCU9612630.1 ABC transporter permease [Perspicuibacillus lycopersici]